MAAVVVVVVNLESESHSENICKQIRQEVEEGYPNDGSHQDME